MAKLAILLTRLLLIGLLAGLAAPAKAMPAPVMTVAQEETETPASWQINQEIPDSYQLVAENAAFELHANPETLAFKVVDKRSGYVWNSSLDAVAEGERLNRTWTAFATSGISIDYMDQRAISRRASITNTDRTIDFNATGQGFEAAVEFSAPSISMRLIVQLEEHGVSVSVPFESIVEGSPNFKLGLLYVYPFFGATRDDRVPGYMFFPDGSGSLIRFQETTKAKNMFYGRYYGGDAGMTTYVPYDPTINRPFRLSIPVTGMVHGEKQNAYLVVVEKGAAFAEIHAHPSGVTTNFNFIYNAFVYNQSYFQATNRSGAGVTTLQQRTNNFDVLLHYRFLTGEDADYVGMARSYQQYLLDSGGLNQMTPRSADIGIRLEFLGGEKERVLLWDRSIPMTTVSQMEEILADLAISNAEVIYYGWQPNGASSMPPTDLRLDATLGTVGQLRALAEEVNARGGQFYLNVDPQAAILNERGYSTRYDLAMSITNANLMGFNRNKVNYFLNLPALTRRYAAFHSAVAAAPELGLALESIGSTLYSDFHRTNFSNRENTIRAYQEMLADRSVRTAFYQPNNYVFPMTDAYFDIPLTDSGYLYTTDVVPFLQVVFAGYVPYYGAALNFSSNPQEDLLRHADFGVYPSFFLTHDVTAKIMNTSSSWIYTSAYQQWGDEIKRHYQWLNNLLSPVVGQQIIAREALQPGVFATRYSNGKQIIVNYSNRLYSAAGVEVNPRDAVLTEVLP